jgi:hypothetical protein
MKRTHQGIRMMLEHPSGELLNIVEKAVKTDQIPPALRGYPPLRLLTLIAYGFFLDGLIKSKINPNRMNKATLAKYHDIAWNKAEVMLVRHNIELPEMGDISMAH